MSFIHIDYPREVLEIGANGQKGYRRIVNNSKELESYWTGKNGIGNIYFTAYGYRGTTPPRHHRVDYNTPIIRHFVMDFDCKDFRNKQIDVEFSFMHEQVKRLHEHFMLNDIEHFVWFSGGGFHIYVTLSEVLMPSNGFEVTRIKDGGKQMINSWHKELNISCNDPTVAFDTAGMIRIPNSYNMRRGCWSIPLTSDEITSLDHYELLDMAQDPREGYIKLGDLPMKFKLPEKRKAMFKKNRKLVNLPDVSYEKIMILPCLVQAALGEGNPTHKARFHLANYLAARYRWFFHPNTVKEDAKKEHIDKIVKLCSQQGWVDFDEGVTRTQVTSIVDGGYSLSSCKTLINEGLCTGICRYYDGTAEDIL